MSRVIDPNTLKNLSFSVYNFTDFEKEAEKIIAEARKKAEQIIEEAKKQKEKLIKEWEEQGTMSGYKEGYKKGYEEGFKKGQQEAQQKFSREVEGYTNTLDNVIKNLDESISQIIENCNKDLLELSFKIAEKIIKKKINSDKDIVLRNLQAAINQIVDRNSLVIKVSPRDMMITEKFMQKLVKVMPSIKGFKVISDSQIKPGGCIVETQQGAIDATIESQLEGVMEYIK